MRLFRKEKAADGRRTVYVLGMRLFSYGGARRRARSRSAVAVNGRGNVVRNRNEGNPHLRIRIFGDGNYVQVDADRPVADICIGAPDCPASNCRVVVGEGTTSNGIFVLLLENGSSVEIGRDCMFSSDISIFASDTHCILDAEGRLLNAGRSVRIGDHVWCGQYAKILKNTSIPDNCVVGMGSVVTRSFDEGNCIIAGSPAKVVKRGISWSRQRPQAYMDEKGAGRSADRTVSK